MGIRVSERRIPVEDILQSHRLGRLRECFGTGTAATLSHVRRIRYRDEDLILPPVEQRKVGPALRERLVAIMTGRAPDSYGWLDRV